MQRLFVMRNIFMFKLVLTVLVLGSSLNSFYAQSNDSVFTYQEYIENIYKFHPIAKKAMLKTKFAKAEMLEAKGGFDPQVFFDWNEKNFDDKLYYRQYQAKLIFPTPLGIDVVGGYENAQGVFLNPENKINDFGLWNLGVEGNLVQGLFVNERKIALEQAEVFQKLAENEQQIILNELIYDASLAYLIWQQYTYFKDVLFENVSIAKEYFENTKQSFLSGEKTGMDTLEASILYQDAIIVQQKNEAELIKSRQMLQNYLWYNEMPVAIQPNIRPENYTNLIFSMSPYLAENMSLEKNPLIAASLNKLSSLEISRRLKKEKLKPKLKLKYNPLLATSQNSIAPNFSINNYKFGLSFSVPLLQRTEKGALQKVDLKMQETKLDIENKMNELQNKMQNSLEQQALLDEQLALLSNNVENYKKLLDGENEKFKYGESSVFLLNKRQEKYINGQLKLIETYTKRQIEILNFLYLTNQFTN
jgi:outer membrane protein TolC